MKRSRRKEIEKIDFYVNDLHGLFQPYEDGRVVATLYLYSRLNGVYRKDIDNYEDPTVDEPYKIIIEGCDDNLFGKCYDSLDNKKLQSLLKLLKSNKKLDTNKIIENYELVRFN